MTTGIWDVYARLNHWALKTLFGIDETAKNAEELAKHMTEKRLRILRQRATALEEARVELERQIANNEMKLRIAIFMQTMGK